MRNLWSDFCTILVSAALLLALVFAFIPASRNVPAHILWRNDQPPKGADAIVILMGDTVDRTPHAAELYKRGYAKKIVFVESEASKLVELGLKPLDGKVTYDYLTKFLNVPAADIIFNDTSRVASTLDESKAILRELEKNKFKNIILVTSWYHSSRALWTFQKANSAKIRVRIFPSPIPKKWYRREQEFLNVYNEYLKWPYNYVRFELLN